MTEAGSADTPLAPDEAHLTALGYGGDFHRSMSLWRRVSRSSGHCSTMGRSPFDGDFFKCHGLFTFARPVQERLPLKIGAMRGPKSFQVAGEFSDGCHHALSYTREAYEYGFEHFRAGAERAEKNPYDLDFAAWVVTAIGRDSAAAKQAARSMVGIYASSMPDEQLERSGVDPADLTSIIEAIGAGDLAKGVELTSPELAEKLSISGTPEEVTSKIKFELEGTGVNHVIAAITDASLVKAFTGQTVEGVATVDALRESISSPAISLRLIRPIEDPS